MWFRWRRARSAAAVALVLLLCVPSVALAQGKKAYKKGIEEYLACEKSNAKLDRAQADLVKVADRFNAQVKAFKAKS